MAELIPAEFDARFVEQFGGSMIRDAETAIVELVANSWDAYATKVSIKWPDTRLRFSIEDNGAGLTDTEFRHIWKTVSYDRISRSGDTVYAPADLPNRPPRRVFGRNGKGRLSGFYFGDTYKVDSWRDGTAWTYNVTRGEPFSIEPVSQSPKRGHGLRITVEPTRQLEMSANYVRQVIANRFLFDPEFEIKVNGVLVTLNDIPNERLFEREFILSTGETITLIVLDSASPHDTTRTHGISWWINRRAVGTISWIWPPSTSLLDGRSSEAKRYSIMIMADALADAVKSDWSGFNVKSSTWAEKAPEIKELVDGVLRGLKAKEREQTLERAVAASKSELEQLTSVDRGKWGRVLEALIEKCPNLSETEITQVMSILAKMEVSESQYSLLTKLAKMDPAEIDGVNDIFEKWTVGAAKAVLDEIETRLKLVEEIDRLTSDPSADELKDLQPLFAKGLWIFGPEFESIEFTSNRTMSTVVRKLLKADEAGSALRPDFVALPDSSIGFYSAPSFDDEHAEVGVKTLVVVELKKPSITIGSAEKDQAWKYVKELLDKGLIDRSTRVVCHIMGRHIETHEGGEDERANGSVKLRAMLYSVFVKRAESRLFKLRDKIKSTDVGSKAAEDGKQVDAMMKYVLT